MTGRSQLFVAVVAAIVLGAIVLLVRRGSLKERFALLWLAIGGGVLALVLVRPWLDRLSESLGIRSGTTTLFLAAIVFLLGLILHLSVVISTLEEKVRDLAEAVALETAEREERAADDQRGLPGRSTE